MGLTFFFETDKLKPCCFAVVAQSVEQRTENPCVDSSILSDGIFPFCFESINYTSNSAIACVK